MNPEKQTDILRKFGIAVWSMATLVLIFIVFLLVNEMMKSGKNPLEMLKPEAKPQAQSGAATPEKKQPETPPNTKEVSLFFVSQDGQLLVQEPRTMECGDSTVENCRHALTELIAGSKKGLTPILPSNVQVRGLYLLEDSGELVIDFSRELISEHARFSSTAMESFMVQGIANTLAQPALQGKPSVPVQRVRFLFEGSPPYEAFPAHIDLSEPVAADPGWAIAPSGEKPHA
jgi:spore germination protein GerM